MSNFKNSYNNGRQATGSFPFLGILTLIFITLKLIGEISWSWWWVLAPMWMPFAAIAIILLPFGIAFLVNEYMIKRRRGY